MMDCKEKLLDDMILCIYRLTECGGCDSGESQGLSPCANIGCPVPCYECFEFRAKNLGLIGGDAS